jgi:hypothetical protein
MNKQDLVAALLKVKEGNIQDTSLGICHNTFEVLKSSFPEISRSGVYRAIMQLATGWEHHTGSQAKPVPFDHLRSVAKHYKWTGEQRKLRHSLIDHLIKQTEALDE